MSRNNFDWRIGFKRGACIGPVEKLNLIKILTYVIYATEKAQTDIKVRGKTLEQV